MSEWAMTRLLGEVLAPGVQPQPGHGHLGPHRRHVRCVELRLIRHGSCTRGLVHFKQMNEGRIRPCDFTGSERPTVEQQR